MMLTRTERSRPRESLLLLACLLLLISLTSCASEDHSRQASTQQKMAHALVILAPHDDPAVRLLEQLSARQPSMLRIVRYRGEADLQSQLQAKRADVVVLAAGGAARRLAQLGLLVPLDTTRIRAWPSVSPALTRVAGVTVRHSIYMVPFETRPLGIVFTRNEGVTPTSFGELFGSSFAGKAAIENDPPVAIMVAALALSYRDPLHMTSAQLSRVVSYLRARRGIFRTYWRDETALAAQFETGDVVVAAAYPSTWLLAHKLGANVGFALPRGPRLLRTTCLAIASGGNRQEAAYELLQQLLSSPMQSKLARDLGSFGVSEKGYGSLPYLLESQARLQRGLIVADGLTIPATLERSEWVRAWYDARAKAG
jgi:spermidine/putrescine-binding protein